MDPIAGLSENADAIPRLTHSRLRRVEICSAHLSRSPLFRPLGCAVLPCTGLDDFGACV